MKTYQAVIFDLDDTLYPEIEYIRSGFRAVAVWTEKEFAIPQAKSFLELTELFAHGVRNNTFDRWLSQLGMNLEIIPQLVQVYREHQPDIHPFKEIPELLSALKIKCRLGLLSDGYRTSQIKKLESLKIASYFDTIVLSDEYGREAWKPNPWIYELTLQKLGVQSCDAVYVSDNPAKDFLGARRVQLSTVRLRTPSGIYANDAPPDSGYAPDIEVSSHKELSDYLLSAI